VKEQQFVSYSFYVYLIMLHILSSLATSLLTPWNRALLDKLTAPHLDKKFLAFYGTWRFITAFTSAWHLSLS